MFINMYQCEQLNLLLKSLTQKSFQRPIFLTFDVCLNTDVVLDDVKIMSKTRADVT